MKSQQGSLGMHLLLLVLTLVIFALYVGTLPMRDPYWRDIFQWLLSQ